MSEDAKSTPRRTKAGNAGRRRKPPEKEPWPVIIDLSRARGKIRLMPSPEPGCVRMLVDAMGGQTLAVLDRDELQALITALTAELEAAL